MRSRASITLWLGGTLLLFHAVIAVAGPWVAPYAQDHIMAGLPLQGASFGHPFGMDQVGRDIFSRTLAGSWIVITLSMVGTILGVVVGASIGLLSGVVGGLVDEAIMRLTEALLSIPFLIFVLLIVSMAGPELQGSPGLLIGAVAAVYVPRIARMSRAAALSVITRDYVLAARLRGEGVVSIARREILPNTAEILMVEFAVRASYAPALIGTLGFLGFGLRPPSPEWGLMIAEYRNLLTAQPMAVFGPGLMLSSLVIGLSFFTEGLSAKLSHGTATR